LRKAKTGADRPGGQLERQLTLSVACVVRDGPPWLAKPPENLLGAELGPF
jgi:hypothetical protein